MNKKEKQLYTVILFEHSVGGSWSYIVEPWFSPQYCGVFVGSEEECEEYAHENQY